MMNMPTKLRLAIPRTKRFERTCTNFFVCWPEKSRGRLRRRTENRADRDDGHLKNTPLLRHNIGELAVLWYPLRRHPFAIDYATYSAALPDARQLASQ